ncbi:hypothetical protein Dimus_035763, partial [Dionaea muscipula]
LCCGWSGGGLAPPASSRRRPSLEGDVLTQPRRHRSFVEECRRHLQVAHPRLMWSYDSPRNRDLRVRSVVERSMREGLGSVEEDLRPDVLTSAAVEDARLDEGGPVHARDSIVVFKPDLGVTNSIEAELLPIAGGLISPESSLLEVVDLLGGSDSVNGGGLVTTVALGGCSAMAGGAKLPVTEGLAGSPELDLTEDEMLTEGPDLVKGEVLLVSVSLDGVSAMAGASNIHVEVESDCDGMPEELLEDDENRLGTSSELNAVPFPDGAVMKVNPLPDFPLAESVCSGALVMLVANGHFSGMEGTELGLLV